MPWALKIHGGHELGGPAVAASTVYTRASFLRHGYVLFLTLHARRPVSIDPCNGVLRLQEGVVGD
jgi:hypothetical protein